MICNLFDVRGSVFKEMKNVEAMNSNLVELTEANFETEVLSAAIPVVVDFYAPWCGPCKVIAPLLEQFAGEFAGRLKFAKANVDATPGLATGLEITGVPTLILFRRGKPLGQLVGFPGSRQFKAWLDAAANTAVTP
ncbi:MAG: thioredoxin [Verrucomicrobiota bacterium]